MPLVGSGIARCVVQLSPRCTMDQRALPLSNNSRLWGRQRGDASKKVIFNLVANKTEEERRTLRLVDCKMDTIVLKRERVTEPTR